MVGRPGYKTSVYTVGRPGCKTSTYTGWWEGLGTRLAHTLYGGKAWVQD